jgi:hypothetical protein
LGDEEWRFSTYKDFEASERRARIATREDVHYVLKVLRA